MFAGFGDPREEKMISQSSSCRQQRSRLEQFGPVPTTRQQLVTLVIAAAAMICISGTLDYLGLL